MSDVLLSFQWQEHRIFENDDVPWQSVNIRIHLGKTEYVENKNDSYMVK